MSEASKNLIAEQIVEKYCQLVPQYKEFAYKLEMLVNVLLQGQKLDKHFSESRAKTPESLHAKLNRPGRNFGKELDEISDLAGVRIVIYYQDDIPKISDLLSQEFEVIERVGNYQPDGYAPDQFGYLSMHFIVKLNSVRQGLPEWKPFRDLKAEIQVRTVLQHSWAAISHALQYKREGDVPRNLRRRLFRLASLFELADEEFAGIREAAFNLREESKQALKFKDKKQIPIDSPAVKSFIVESSDMAKMRQDLEDLGYSFRSKKDFSGVIVEESDRLGLESMEVFDNLVKNYRTSFFENITPGLWDVEESFILLLAIIDKYSDKFSQKYLVEKGWSMMLAEKVLRNAGKNG